MLSDAGNYEGAYTPWRMPRPTWSAFRGRYNDDTCTYKVYMYACMYGWLEASFGVASIKFISDTKANFSWHRHACNGANNSKVRFLYIHVCVYVCMYVCVCNCVLLQLYNYGMNFSDACVTPGDNGGYNMSTSDITTFTRPSKSACPNRWVSTLTYSSPQVVPAYTPTSCPTTSCRWQLIATCIYIHTYYIYAYWFSFCLYALFYARTYGSSSNNDYATIVSLSVACALLGLSTIVLASIAFFLYMTTKVQHSGDDDSLSDDLTDSERDQLKEPLAENEEKC